MKKTLLFFSLVTLVAANPFDTTLKEEVLWLKDETFVISASKVKEEIKKTSASVFIIDSETINTMGAQTLLEALRIVPGLDIVQSNIYVNKINVHGIQTFFSEKVLILLDGHSLNSNLLDGGATTAYGNFPLDHVERIEIIKSPSSALYGENAFMALINIITKKAKEIDGTKAGISFGNNNAYMANLLWGESYNDFDIALDLNYRDSDGSKVFVTQDAAGLSGNTHPYSRNLYSNLFVQHTSGIYFKGNYNYSKDGPHFGAVNVLNDEDATKRKAWFIEAGYRHSLSNILNLDTRIYRDYFEYDSKWRVYPKGLPSPEYTQGMLGYVGIDNIKTGAETFVTFEKDNFTLAAGTSYEFQEIKNPWQKMNWNPLTLEPLTSVQNFSSSDTNYISEHNREFFAFYGELLYDFNDDLRFNTGVRYDHYSDFGGVLNPRLGLSYQLNTNNTVKMIYGEAFKAPTFSELYNINNPVSLGNPDLKPERIKTVELTLQNSSIKNLHMSLNFFKSHINDIIIIVDNTHVNQGEVFTEGIEVQLKQDLYRGSYILANYTYQNPKNNDTHETVADIAKHMGYLSLNYRVNRYFNLYIDAKYRGEQTRPKNDIRGNVDSTITNNAVFLIKDYPLNALQTKLFIDNAFNQSHFDSNTPYDYPLAKRSYGVELSYVF